MPMLNQPPEDFYCSQLALESDEVMAGTAVSAPVWILLEYRQLWQAEATSDNTLPVSVKMWLDEQVGAVNGRLQFIRQTPYPEQYTCFVSIPDAQKPRLYRFTFAEYEQLLTIDLAALVNGAARFAPYLTIEPLFLVCTNGKRDRCCAKFGMALYQAFSHVVETAVWQTTHLGGHRFAPTLMSFPEGVCYGHITRNDIPKLLAAQQNGDIFLPKLRGRAVYDAITQLAEYYLCQENSQPSLTTFQHISTHSPQENEWIVRFQEVATKQTYQVNLTEDDPQTIYASCGSVNTKNAPVYQYKHLSKIE